MYIHLVKSGSCNQYVKRLLRIGRREGRRVNNSTILDLTWWPKDALDKLQVVLEMKRRNRNTWLEQEANTQIVGIIGETLEREMLNPAISCSKDMSTNQLVQKLRRTEKRVTPSSMWQVLCSLDSKRFTKNA